MRSKVSTGNISWIKSLVFTGVAGLIFAATTPIYSQEVIMQTPKELQDTYLAITVGSHTFNANWENNSSAKALHKLLTQGPITITVKDYGGFEKSGALGHTLPQNDHWIRTNPGDVVLYQGNVFVIFYDHHQWDLTRLARIKNPENLQRLLRKDPITLTLTIETKTQ